MLQPRRIAARSAAKRIADEQGWLMGQEVGYQVRFENRTTNNAIKNCDRRFSIE
jgi:ATP-dependent helicase HrpB